MEAERKVATRAHGNVTRRSVQTIVEEHCADAAGRLAVEAPARALAGGPLLPARRARLGVRGRAGVCLSRSRRPRRVRLAPPRMGRCRRGPDAGGLPAPDRSGSQVCRALDRAGPHDRGLPRRRARPCGDAGGARARRAALSGPRASHRRTTEARALLRRTGISDRFRTVPRRWHRARRDAAHALTCRACSAAARTGASWFAPSCANIAPSQTEIFASMKQTYFD